jgi:hypothetical protein
MRAVLACLLLTGCMTSDTNVYGVGFGQNVSGNETYVSISNVWNEQDALPLAERHCKQFGKLAQFKHQEGHRSIFNCVRS